MRRRPATLEQACRPADQSAGAYGENAASACGLLSDPGQHLLIVHHSFPIPHNIHLHIGFVVFEGIDQIDLTGPFEVLSRIPNSTYRIYGKTAAPVRDLKGLRLTLDAAVAGAPPLDVLHVPGGLESRPIVDIAEPCV